MAVALELQGRERCPFIGEAAPETPSDWIKESFNIAETTAYSGPIGTGDGPFILTPEYKDNAKKIADQRVDLAGERLANLINAERK